MDEIDVMFNVEGKAEFFREKVAEGLDADRLFAGLAGNIALGGEALAEFHFAELKALVKAYQEYDEQRYAELTGKGRG